MKNQRGKLFTKCAIVAAAFLMVFGAWGTAAAQAVLVIEDWEVEQNLVAADPAGVYSNFVTDTNGDFFGSQRTFVIDKAAASTQFFTMRSTNGADPQGTFGQEPNICGFGSFTWETLAEPDVDLTDGATKLVMYQVSSDLNVTIRLAVHGGGNTAYADIVLTGGAAPIDVSLDFGTDFMGNAAALTSADKIEVLVPNNLSDICAVDLVMEEIQTECVDVQPVITTLEANPPSPIANNPAATTEICWATTGATEGSLNGVPIVPWVSNSCKTVTPDPFPATTNYKLEIANECLDAEADIDVERQGPPTGACCTDPDVPECTDDITAEACDLLGGTYGGDDSTCNEIELTFCQPPPPPVVPAFTAAGLLAFAGLFPLAWIFISRRRKG